MDTQLYELTQFGAGIMALALVVWIVRRVFSHTIPRLATDFRESLTSIQQHFKDEIAASREAFRQELALQRGDFKDALKDEREGFGRKLDRLADAVEELIRQRK